ncbi:MAG: hypothetical protein EBX39_07295, partial [Actinobacteria bacterium]|nr:hypothetical protein [Actinomycetota bacterium]
MTSGPRSASELHARGGAPVSARPEQSAFDFGDLPADEAGGEPAGTKAPRETGSDQPATRGSVVRVRPDQPAIDRLFDYTVPTSMQDQIR